jgi:NTP pyrophosphatase (non-canonical NTP hydrolase)
MKTINQLVTEAHENAKSKGWWDEDRSFGEVIALMHSELSEALEDYRDGIAPDQMFYQAKDGSVWEKKDDWFVKPCGIPSELADVVIRVFDACGRYGIDLESAIAEKMAYNATRPHKHGGKVI